MGGATSKEPSAVPIENAPLAADVRASLMGPVGNWLQRHAPLWFLRASYDSGASAIDPKLCSAIACRDFFVPADKKAGAHLIPCRMYSPKRLGDDAAVPLIFAIHGGGFVLGSLDSHHCSWLKLAHDTGYRVLAVDYRLAPEAKFPTAPDDCWAVYQAMCEQPEHFQHNGRIAIVGDSAGAVLTLGLSMRVRDALQAASSVEAATGGAGAAPTAPWPSSLIAPSLVYAFYPAAAPWGQASGSWAKYGDGYVLLRDCVDYYVACYVGATPAEQAAHASDPLMYPITQPDFSGLPPTVIMTAECDPLHDEGVALVEAARARGGSGYEHIEGPGQVHGFMTRFAHVPSSAVLVEAACARIKTALAEAGKC